MQPRRCWLPLLLLTGSAAFAQAPTGAIAGTVYDASGGVVPNASITVKSTDTAFDRALKSNQAGQYSAPPLAAGTYEIKASAAGFPPLDTKAVVTTGNTPTVSPHLQGGRPRATVTRATAAD